MCNWVYSRRPTGKDRFETRRYGLAIHGELSSNCSISATITSICRAVFGPRQAQAERTFK